MNIGKVFKTFGKVKSTNPGTLNDIKRIIDDHAPTILCAGSGIALGLCIFSAFKASKNVVKIRNRYEEKSADIQKDRTAGKIDDEEMKDLEREARINRDVQYALAYKYVALFGFLSFGCSFASNRISGSKIAGLTVALAASEDKLKKFAKSVKDKVGSEEFKEIRDDFRKEVLDEKMNGDTPFDVSKKSDGENEILIFDTYLGSPFWGTVDDVENAIALAEEYIKRNHVLNYNKWRGFLGLPDCPAGGVAEWNPLHPFKAKLGSIFYEGDEVVAIIFEDEEGNVFEPATRTLALTTT